MRNQSVPDYKIVTKSGVALSLNKEVTDGAVELSISREKPEREFLLHWGVRRGRGAWQIAPRSMWPEASRAVGDSAVQSRFQEKDGRDRVVFKIDRPIKVSSIDFALFFPADGRWDNNGGQNYRVEVPRNRKRTPSPARVVRVATSHEVVTRQIVENETKRDSWTLMHRFDLCYDLIDDIPDGDEEGLALIFVWLRFSAIRQLDWQRNYNTKPRELGHSLDRLTLKLADRFHDQPGDRPWIRLIMGTLGRGSDAQRVRDEVLNIMHRHHIKEVSGHFMEEWHQKLHNNTTVDDIVICEALLGFLRSNGNREVFYHTLNEQGISRERLQSYERPIRSEPDFVPHLKDALIADFEYFLGVLKEVHSGTDLGVAIRSAKGSFDEELAHVVDFLWQHRDGDDLPIASLVEKVTEARRLVRERLDRGNQTITREFVFLEVALEEFFRTAIERNIHLELEEHEWIKLIAETIENLILSQADEELSFSLNQWKVWRQTPVSDTVWAIESVAVMDRVQRAVSDRVDHLYRVLQPIAEALGNAFAAEPWTVRLFSEVVVRGRVEPILSALVRRLTPLIRNRANLGNWQIVSRNEAVGEIRVVSTLRAVQEERFDSPTLIVADKVSGDEEIPRGVTAVITPDTVDVVSHLAIRARNAGLLFATCYDQDEVIRLKSMKGRWLRLRVDAAGTVLVNEASRDESVARAERHRAKTPLFRPSFTTFALARADFSPHQVGGKSNNLNRLTGQLPEWIKLPSSAAVPFGVFEKVIAQHDNRETARRLQKPIEELETKQGQDLVKALEIVRQTIGELKAPSELVSAVQKVIREERLIRDERWEDSWMCIKKVWASKWNERAYLSRTAYGISHEDLYMAVLIQRMVEADFSFVIHTVNPLTGNRDELYAEVVLGLGETLVGNYPGRALGFTCRKGEGADALRVLTYPSKTFGLFGGGLIFRSDSNGEDLAEYAGAGLYDSFMLEPSRKVRLDYCAEPLIRDKAYQHEVLTAVAKIGQIVETLMGSPQDIEGAHDKDGFYVVQTRPQVGLG
jgi:alpha-glucan,water dikinase